jgi:hypothetical protein
MQLQSPARGCWTTRSNNLVLHNHVDALHPINRQTAHHLPVEGPIIPVHCLHDMSPLQCPPRTCLWTRDLPSDGKALWTDGLLTRRRTFAWRSCLHVLRLCDCRHKDRLLLLRLTVPTRADYRKLWEGDTWSERKNTTKTSDKVGKSKRIKSQFSAQYVERVRIFNKFSSLRAPWPPSSIVAGVYVAQKRAHVYRFGPC